MDPGRQELPPRSKVAAYPALPALLQTLSGNFDLQSLSPGRQASSERSADLGQGGLPSGRDERVSEDHPDAEGRSGRRSADPEADAEQHGPDTDHHCQAGQNLLELCMN